MLPVFGFCAELPRLPVAAKIDGQHAEPCLCKRFRLLAPTLLGEAPSMSEHDGSITFSVEVGVKAIAIWGRKRNRLLRGS